ncbi:hypothetical protein P3342_003966 [Pyrenophora teres f. teres]|nr:hypothetical protein P3342_003966 [Pyrenophora teres f. teres]
MRYSSTAALLSLASLGQASPAPHVHQHAHAARDLVGLGSLGSQYQAGVYFTNWGIYARNYTVSDLPIDRLTYVNYAFANVNRTTGEVFLSDEWSDIQRPYPTDVATNGSQLLGNFNQLYKAKQKNRNLKVILGVGGWTWRFNFSPALSTRAGRVNYCKSSLKLITDLGIDGLDTDWEYVANEVEAANLLDTMQTCRQMFDEYSKKYTKGYHYELSISAPAGPQHYSKLNIKELDRYIDRWNLMAFDYQGGGFSNYTGHLSNVYASTTNPRSTDGWVNETQSFAPFNTKAAIDYYKTRVASPPRSRSACPSTAAPSPTSSISAAVPVPWARNSTAPVRVPGRPVTSTTRSFPRTAPRCSPTGASWPAGLGTPSRSRSSASTPQRLPSGRPTSSRLNASVVLGSGKPLATLPSAAPSLSWLLLSTSSVVPSRSRRTRTTLTTPHPSTTTSSTLGTRVLRIVCLIAVDTPGSRGKS